MSALIDWIAERYGWGFEEIMWGVPLSAICLLRRRAHVKPDGTMTIFPLSEVEKEDDKKCLSG